MFEPTFWASLGVKVGLGHVFKLRDISKYFWAQYMFQPMPSRTLWPKPVHLFISLILCRRFLSLNNINVRDGYTSKRYLSFNNFYMRDIYTLLIHV